MASAYALPPPVNGSDFLQHHHHVRSHSYSSSHHQHSPSLSSDTSAQHKPSSLSVTQLYTHREASREASPLTSPDLESFPSANSLQQNASAVHANGRPNLQPHVHHYQIGAHAHDHDHGHDHGHDHSHDHSHDHNHHHNHNHASVYPSAQPHDHSDPMKSRLRGQSDLARPISSTYQDIPLIPAASWSSLETLTSLLIPLPYIFVSAAYHPRVIGVEDGLSPPSAYARLRESVLGDDAVGTTGRDETNRSALLEACTLTSGTLLLVAILAKIRSSERMLDRRKDVSEVTVAAAGEIVTATGIRKVLTRSLSVGLPFYATLQIGGMRTGLVLLVSAGSALAGPDFSPHTIADWAQILHKGWATLAIIVLGMVLDFSDITIGPSALNISLGYLALVCSVFMLPFPLPPTQIQSTHRSGAPRLAWSQSVASPLVSSVGDVNATLAAGILMSILTIATSLVLSTSPPITFPAITFSSLALASSAAAVLFAVPTSLHSRYRAGLGIGSLFVAVCTFISSPSFWPSTVLNCGLCVLSYFGVLYNTASTTTKFHNEDHDHDHAHHVHLHHHHHDGRYSWFTTFLIERCEPGSLVYSILSEKDSRRIAYFTCLNFSFMFIQGIYGYISGSLGLLSDTVHMFFDCLGLIVGLGAAVASKWPTSPEKPYGWGKLNVLAGFGNGIFLMLVSVEFVWEAFEGIAERKELRHVEELLVVSTLGFLVNMVGLFAFGHAHAGHDHGHSHSHSHTHAHSHSISQEHEHAHSHQHSLGCDHDHAHKGPSSNGSIHGHDSPVAKTPAHGHGHHDHNENMEGIFLHVAADAGGSAAVIISTALTLWKPWYLWDPLATILIAILIFAAAVPLVTSSGRKLLLVIPDELEYNIKHTLQELGELRGIVGYAVPRFWLDDKDAAADSHGHHHHHGHDHDHDHGSHGRDKVLGVIHVIANPAADLDDVRHRVDEFFHERNMDVLVHVESQGEGQCWCGGGNWGSR